jgi:hypothetical protein
MLARLGWLLPVASVAFNVFLGFGITRAESGPELLQRLQTLGSSDESNRIATSTLKQLKTAPDVNLFQTLKAMKGATPIGRNWLLGLANTLYQKAGKAQQSELNAFLMDTNQDGEARFTVFEWLIAANPELRPTLLSKMRQDPSPELRYLSVSDALESKPMAKELESLLDAARHPEQVVEIIKRLKEAGTTIDQAKQFGFVMDWKLIGPFDHVGTANFDKVFEVEADWLAGKVKDEYAGKSTAVKWLSETSKNEEGIVDLAALYANEKGCIIYAMTEFESDREQDAELRLGCINGNKAWLNGKLVMSNEVYHTNMQIDQYNERVRLLPGTNRILLKIAQNEQKEQWAQRYAFQLRVSDLTGKAILEKGK